MDKKIFSLDRIEGELAVCISDEDEQVIVPLDMLGGLCERDVFSARIDGELLADILPLPEERDRRIEDTRRRLHALAKRRKNKS